MTIRLRTTQLRLVVTLRRLVATVLRLAVTLRRLVATVLRLAVTLRRLRARRKPRSPTSGNGSVR
ncbi:MAG: hypothetical protein KF850_36815 [Labilithrix sp.]|nr:hypothetical protein [Labilithrix sp.]